LSTTTSTTTKEIHPMTATTPDATRVVDALTAAAAAAGAPSPTLDPETLTISEAHELAVRYGAHPLTVLVGSEQRPARASTSPTFTEPAFVAPGAAGEPTGKPIAAMTDAEAAAYWRSHSRRHEAAAAAATARLTTAHDLLPHDHPREALAVLDRALYPVGEPITYTVNR
jgi:hypothetical protein